MLKVEFILLVPLLAALLISLVPPLDIRTRITLSFGLQIIWLGLILFLGFKNILDPLRLALLLAQTIVLTGVRFQKNSSPLLPPMFWFLTSLSTATLLSTNLSLMIIFAYLHIIFLLFVILQTGGLYKGQSTYESILFFLTLDLTAFFSLSLPYSWTYWVLILPGLARILFPFTAPFARNLFVNCPTEIMLLMLGGLIPIGILWLSQIPLPCPRPEQLEVIGLGGSLFAIVLFLIEKSRRQKTIYLFMTQSSLCAHLILKSNIFGSFLSLAALLNLALGIYFLEFPKVRFFTIPFAALTLFLSVYQL